jgi:hypothetical protein
MSQKKTGIQTNLVHLYRMITKDLTFSIPSMHAVRGKTAGHTHQPDHTGQVEMQYRQATSHQQTVPQDVHPA